MAKLILVMGDLAAGKSTFSRLIAKKYHLVVYNKDRIKEILSDAIGFKNREENYSLSQATFKLFGYLLDELSCLNQDVILESNFRQEELDILDEWAKANHYQVLSLVLKGDIDVLHKRYMYRIQHENRHQVHLTLPLDDLSQFRYYVEKQRSQRILGEVIAVDANDFSYQHDEQIWKQIAAFLEK